MWLLSGVDARLAIDIGEGDTKRTLRMQPLRGERAGVRRGVGPMRDPPDAAVEALADNGEACH